MFNLGALWIMFCGKNIKVRLFSYAWFAFSFYLTRYFSRKDIMFAINRLENYSKKIEADRTCCSTNVNKLPLPTILSLLHVWTKYLHQRLLHSLRKSRFNFRFILRVNCRLFVEKPQKFKRGK